MSFYIKKTKSLPFTMVPKQVNTVKVDSKNEEKVDSKDDEKQITNTEKVDSKDKQEIPVFDVYNNLTQNTNPKKLSSKSVLTYNEQTNSWSYDNVDQ